MDDKISLQILMMAYDTSILTCIFANLYQEILLYHCVNFRFKEDKFK